MGGDTGGSGGRVGRRSVPGPGGRETATFWNSPMGLLRVLVAIVVGEAVEGGLPEARGDEIYDELCSRIEQQDGCPCPCGNCDYKLSLEDVALRALDKIAPVLDRVRGDGCGCGED